MRTTRWVMAIILGTIISTTAWCATTPSAEAAKKAEAAWSPAFRSLLGFENAARWSGKCQTVDSPKKQGAHALKWANHTKVTGFAYTPKQPLDLSAFNKVSFWLHSNEDTGETFKMVLPSKHDPKVNSYLILGVKVDWKGWKKVEARYRDFGMARNPVGWSKIDGISFTAAGWNQDPSDKPVWVLDDLQFSFDPKPYHRAIKYKQYVAPPKPEAFLEKLHRAHPRLILLDKDLPRIKKFIAEDPTGKEWYKKIAAKAEMYRRRTPQYHHLPDGRRLLSVSRDVLHRMYHWGFMYRITGDRKWLDRAYQELEAVVAFPDWNPSHYLDTAEMMHAVGIGYDWLYNDLTEAQRKTVRDGLWKHGLRLSYAAYMGLRAEGMQGWPRVTNNWNFVCNGGTGIAAMAVLDDMPQKATEILHAGFQYIQVPIEHFEPDGAWWEGLGYWGYSLMYFSSYLRGLETSFGTDFGFVKGMTGKGFSMAGDFPIYLVSPLGGTFNFADSGSGEGSYEHWSLFYLAARFHNPLYLDFQKKRNKGSLFDLLYYEPFDSDLAPQDVALDKYFRKTEVASMRSSWTDHNAAFVGVKAGKNGIAHAHQDLGSFIFYALGEKWVKDMGTEGQTYQGHKHHISHHDFYRIRDEGHNTLVFDPDEHVCQNRRAMSNITRFETSPGDVIAVVDLSDAYKKYTKSVRRGYRLFDDRRAFLVQDEIQSDKAHEIWWFAHGDDGATYEVAETGRSVKIVRDDAECSVYLLSPATAKLEVMDARPLPTSPDPSIQQQNLGIKKLAVHLKDTKNAIITVLYVPHYAFEPEPKTDAKVEPIDSWKLDGKIAPTLSGIAVNGEALADFSPNVLHYAKYLNEKTTDLPKVTATANADVRIEPAKQFPGTTRITVSKGGAETLYLLRFLEPLPVDVKVDPAVNPKPKKVDGITVTASEHDGNAHTNVLDGNLKTRWSAFGKHHWIAFDFGAPRELAGIQIAWFNGNQRRSKFDVSVSDDGKTWRKVFSGQSSGKSVKLENHAFKSPVKTQHVRIDGYGNSDNEWNSITEVKF